MLGYFQAEQECSQNFSGGLGSLLIQKQLGFFDWELAQ